MVSFDGDACAFSVGDEQEVEDNTVQENFEDRLSECIEGLLVKRYGVILFIDLLCHSQPRWGGKKTH